MASLTTTPAGPAAAARAAARRGFTLVEMMVVVVLIVILASMTLAGLSVARQRARVARTKTTIRKLHEIVVPRYEGYLRRRIRLQDVETPRTDQCSACYEPTDEEGSPSRLGRVNAWKTLVSKRRWLVFEMPDSWGDVGTAPGAWRTGPVRAFAASKAALQSQPIAAAAASFGQFENGNAECLYMLVARGGLEPDLLQQFHSTEIGDVDQDGAPEFLDGWGRPIVFLRWAPGFTSAVQVANATTHHDPFDPQRVDAAGYGLVPLIVSGGGDLRIALWFELASGWQQWRVAPGLQSIVGLSSPVLGSVASASEAVDNVTNHDLGVR